MNTTLEKLKERIKDKKYKLTTQRQTILQAFIDADENHLSAEDVYVLVKEVAPDIGLATIYRTLDLFTELDLLKRLDFGDGRNRYELNDEEFAHFHHHLICVKCGKVSEFEDDMLETLESIIAKKLNFRTIDHQLKVYGYCSDCQNHMTEAELEKLERMAHHHA
ncbi:MAG: transcriptional repressor [Veillonella sp.]|jgi:Fur family ferric uptake transcriptional regulator|uniref:Transcriptional repressor n=3 Tax=Veillonella TaxID=29465 RepID=A0ABX5C4X9_9FIRM|nr:MULTISPECIES: Fur family transcriptional regulator [Veillonella]MBS5336335.1 transcriptional repressor [Veillonella sp.]PQL11377.1 transcriptional repressor [Veillonella sp. T11011-6]PQL57662.1 transcriptional repressor [Veillonella infantium]